jgi:hypothetical protein
MKSGSPNLLDPSGPRPVQGLLYLYPAILMMNQMEIKKVNAAELYDQSIEESGLLLKISNKHKQIFFMYNGEEKHQFFKLHTNITP